MSQEVYLILQSLLFIITEVFLILECLFDRQRHLLRIGLAVSLLLFGLTTTSLVESILSK